MHQDESNGKPIFNKRQTIPPEEWHQCNRSIRTAKDDLNKLVMNFFIVEGIYYLGTLNLGYKDAA